MKNQAIIEFYRYFAILIAYTLIGALIWKTGNFEMMVFGFLVILAASRHD